MQPQLLIDTNRRIDRIYYCTYIAESLHVEVSEESRFDGERFFALLQDLQNALFVPRTPVVPINAVYTIAQRTTLQHTYVDKYRVLIESKT